MSAFVAESRNDSVNPERPSGQVGTRWCPFLLFSVLVTTVLLQILGGLGFFSAAVLAAVVRAAVRT